MVSEVSDKTKAETDQGFLTRWSRRKQEEEQLALDGSAPASVLESKHDSASVDRHGKSTMNDVVDVGITDDTDGDTADSANSDEEELLTDADMPAIETITSKSDLSMFFNRGVSRELRKAALKHLFGLPALNITDGLNDYDEDYTTFEPLGDIVTSDMRFHAERKARRAEEEEARKLAEADASETNDAEASTETPQDADAEQAAENETAEESNPTDSPIQNADEDSDALEITDQDPADERMAEAHEQEEGKPALQDRANV